jgi:hypothetical protein
MTASELYDATIRVGWTLARCLHLDPDAASDALVSAYVELGRARPDNPHEARLQLLSLLCDQAGHRREYEPLPAA